MGFSFLLVKPLPHGLRLIDLGPAWSEEPEGPTPRSHRTDLPAARPEISETVRAIEAEEEAQGGTSTAHPPACGNEMVLQLPPRDPLLFCVLERYGKHFGRDGEVLESGPCGNGEGGAGLLGYEHPSISQLRDLHDRPKKRPGAKAKAGSDSWYLGYDGVDAEYEARAVRAQACLRVIFRACLREEKEERKKAVVVENEGGRESGMQELVTSAMAWHGCDLASLHGRFHGEDHPHQHVFAQSDMSGLERDAARDGGLAVPGGDFRGESGEREEDKPAPRVDKSASLAESLQHRRRILNGEGAAGRESDGEHTKHLGFWIGPPALDGVWKEPAAGTVLDSRFAHVHSGLTKWGKMGESFSGSAECLKPRNCSFFDTHAPFEENPVDLQAAKFRCAPTFVIPGTQKGASTFLFHALSRHPQVVPPLRGAHGYKEAGAYVLQNCRRKPRQIGNRVHRFPFIEADEPFATGGEFRERGFYYFNRPFLLTQL